MEKPLVNRVASSGIITLNLEDYFPVGELKVFDIKAYLFHGLILKEKDFRTALKEHDWEQYSGKNLAIHCSADAIIPIWAYMLVANYAQPYANMIVEGDENTFYATAYHKALAAIVPSDFDDKRIVIKGCSNKPVPVSAYVELTRLLRPFAKSIMYGEPCSTVPIYKKPRPKRN